MRKQNSDFHTAFLSEAGNQLKNNDYFGFVELDEYACYVIADGITDMPDINSARLAIETVILHFQSSPSMSRRKLKYLVSKANKALIDTESYKRQEASLTVVLTDYKSIRYGYVGNTRLRMYRGGAVFRQTEDMSYSQELVNEEKIAKDVLKKHEERNNLYSYLGQRRLDLYISQKIKLMDTDIITIYTRGIWENVDAAELDDVFSNADNEVQKSLDEVEDLLLSKQPEDLENYTFAAIFINKVYSDPKRDQKRKKTMIIILIVVLVVIVLIALLVFLYIQKKRRIEDMNYYFTNTIEYINDGNFIRAKEECEKAQEMSAKLKDHAMRDRLQEYMFVIETVILADDSFEGSDYDQAQDYYNSAMDRVRFADFIGKAYMESRLEKISDYISVSDYIMLGDSLLEKENYEKAEEKYLYAKNLAASCHYADGKEVAMTALENLYKKWSEAEYQKKQEVDEQTKEELSAAEFTAKGDKACLEQDYTGANVYYTMALTKYQELGDTENQQYVSQKMDSVKQMLSEQENKRNRAADLERQGAQSQSSGDYWSAKSQYLQAKNLYLELSQGEDVERITNIVAQIDAMIEQQ